MTSEIRTNSLKSRAGLSTVTMTDSGPMFSGITTFVDNSGFTFGVGGGTSIFTPATNVLTFGTNNTEKIRIDASGHMHGVGVITATHFYGDGSNLTGLSGVSVANQADNRLITATGTTDALNGEANLTFDGSNLGINGDLVGSNNTTLYSTNGGSGVRAGLSLSGSDQSIKFYTVNGGSERLRIDSSGRLLVGSTSTNQNISKIVVKASSPSDNYDNHIYLEGSETSGDANTGGVLGFGGHDGGGSFRNWANIWGVKENGTGGNTASYMAFHTRAAGGNPSEKVRIDSNGRLQINQTTNYTGTAKLEVMGTGDNSYPQYSFAIGVADTQAYNVSNGTGMGIGFSYKHNSAGSYALGCGIRGFKENTTDGNYAGAMAFYTRANGAGASEGMRLTSAGDLIVHGSNLNNSSVSGQALQINGTTRPTLILRGNASGGNTCEIQFADNSGTDSDPGTRVGLIKYEHAGTYANHMHFHTSGTERVVISHSGRFGIANSAAQIASFAENLQVTATYGGGQYGVAVKLNQSSGSLMRFATTDPTNGQFALCGSVTGNGTSCSFNTSSDYRLKENDVKISDGITRVKQLRPIRFNWKSDSSSTEDGFFAHEVSPVVPESVTGEKDATIDEIGEGYQKIDHSKLVPLLTAALQEAIAKIETLEQDNITLRARVTNLEGN